MHHSHQEKTAAWLDTPRSLPGRSPPALGASGYGTTARNASVYG